MNRLISRPWSYIAWGVIMGSLSFGLANNWYQSSLLTKVITTVFIFAAIFFSTRDALHDTRGPAQRLSDSP